MKKLKLSLLQSDGSEILSREQLRKITGGENGSDPTINCPPGMIPCTCESDTNQFYGCVEVWTDCWLLC